jgi:signal transduction histidine kinase/ligand-binding sensor domain-containing protein
MLLMCVCALPQKRHIRFDHIGTRDGLSQSNVTCVLHDSRGFMWFGTSDGLNKYDGYSFTIYQNIPGDRHSLSNNYVKSIAEAKNGDLWIATLGGGLCRYNRLTENFTVYRNNPSRVNSLSADDLNQVMVDHTGMVWIGTNMGLDMYDPQKNTFTHFPSDKNDPSTISDTYITALMQDSDHIIWVGTRGGGLNRLDPATKKFTRFAYSSKNSNSISSNYITSIFEDSKGRLWVGTEADGLNQLVKETGSFRHFKQDNNNTNSLVHNDVVSINEDNTGRLWIATENNGISVYNPETNVFQAYQYDDLDNSSPGTNSMNCVYKDKKQNMWIGTYNAGIDLVSVDALRFTHYKRMHLNSSLNNNHVLCIYEDSRKNIWIGTDGGGLNLFDPRTGNFTYYRHNKSSNSLAGDHVLSVTEDSKGNLWVGTWGEGITVFNSRMQVIKQFRHQAGDSSGLNNNNVWTIFEDSKQNIWIGTYGGGVNLFNPANNTFTHFTYNRTDTSPVNSNWINSITEDRDGHIWIGTSGGGLLRMDPATKKSISFMPVPGANSISNVNTGEVYEDRHGKLWIGTIEGLNCYDKKTGRFTIYNQKHGLADNTVHGILEDRRGNLWISTNRGLTRFNPALNRFQNFDRSDGIQSDEFKQKAYCLSSSGEMYFGGNNGFNRFYPDQIKIAPFDPPLVITSFQVFNKQVPIASGEDHNSPLKQSITEAKSITLSHKHSVFSIEFATLNYTPLKKKWYAYKLEGFDPEWNKGTRRTATYTNLDPGTYIFKVRGLNNDGSWSPNITRLEVIITPPIWRTWIFRITVLFGLAGCILAFYRVRVRNIEMQQKELQLMVRAQTKKLVNANKELEMKNKDLEQFAYVASHDLQEPLRTTASFAELLEQQYKGKLDETADKYLMFIVQSSERMKVLIKDLLDYSRIGRKKEIQTIDCNLLLREVIADLGTAINETGAIIQFENLPVIQGYSTEIKQLFQNLILNAIKFTREDVEPRIRITFKKTEEHWQFAVEDNGIGIAEEHRERIFNIFQRLHTRNEYPGSGIGLSHCKKIAELHEGKIWVESEPGQGSTFFFTINYTL